MVGNMRKIEEVRIDHKISASKFLKILESGPEKVVIPASVLRQSKTIELFLDVMEIASTKGWPKIEIVERGKPPKVIEQDWVDPYIRSLVGTRPNPEDRLLVYLLDARRDVCISELAPGEVSMLPGLRELGRIDIIEGLNVRLTETGKTVARGAKKLFPDL
jgi:hypothetical protein